jgi:hypothetical protein
MTLSGAGLGFVGPETYTVFEVHFEEKNIKVGTKVIIYLEREKNHKNTNLKKPTNTTNITKSRKIT